MPAKRVDPVIYVAAKTDAKLVTQEGEVLALKRVHGNDELSSAPRNRMQSFSLAADPRGGSCYGCRFKPASGMAELGGRIVDPVLLTAVTKSGDAVDGWTLHTTWLGGAAPYTVVSSTDPSFQKNVITDAAELPSFNLDMDVDSSDPGRYFSVVDGSTVSPAVQGIGYDPLPAPAVTSASASNAWWGDTVTLTGQYFSPIDSENLAYINDLGVKAFYATPPTSGSSYSTSVKFEIPEDARSFLATVYSYGKTDKSGAPPIFMSPPGIGPYTAITGVSFSPVTGHVWVAAQEIVQDVDLFLVVPVATTVGAFTQPYISRVTTGGNILVIDRSSPLEIKEINSVTQGVTTYAWTADEDFTRSIDPVGLAVDPDGSVAYVADNSTGNVIRIPRNAGSGSSTITDQWGGLSLSFVDPVGIDVAPGHQVIVADNGTQYTVQLTGPSSYSYQHHAGQNVRSIEVDRGVSSWDHFRYVIDGDPGMTEAFNRNPIGSAAEAQFHGGRVYGLLDGTLRLNYDWLYKDLHRGPKRILLSNSVSDYPYPTEYQTEDRVIAMEGKAWADVPVRLRLIDPPDLAPYAPEGGWSSTGDLPYEGNDNVVWGWAGGAKDYGLSLSPTGPWYESIEPVPGSKGGYAYYLKVPPDVSGENFQVEITKCPPDASGRCINLLQDQVVGMSGIYTSWKRIFIERDRMFRKGGVLAEDYVPVAGCGSPAHPICDCITNPDENCCKGIGPLRCNQLLVYEWQTAAKNNLIAVFDEVSNYETFPEYASVTRVSPGLGHGLLRITVDHGLSWFYDASDRTEPDPPAQYQPTFFHNHSAGFGVVSNCDLSSKQINASNSCLFDPDLRGLEQPFGDAFVEFFAPRDGMSAVPFLPPGFFDAYEMASNGTCDSPKTQPRPNYNTDPWLAFARTWFEMYPKSNYLWFGGVDTTASLKEGSQECMVCGGVNLRPQILGASFPWEDRETYVFVGGVKSFCPAASQMKKAIQGTTTHELGHHFFVNAASNPPFHDDRCEWTADGTLDCNTLPYTCTNTMGACLMNPSRNHWDTDHRFDRFDLFCGDSACPNGTDGCCVSCQLEGNGSIRRLCDPLPGGE